MTTKSFEKMVMQYASAKGKNEIHINSKEFLLEFGAWLKKYKKASEEYLFFLDEIGLKFNNILCAEVGKNQYDSVVMKCNSKIITPNASDFTDIDSERVIEGKLKVYNSTPFLVRSSLEDVEIPKVFIDTYMMHNPNSVKDIEGWEDLHNYNKNNIIVGIFGSLNDKDKDEKIKLLIQFKNKLNQYDYKEEYKTIDDMYFYVVGSKQKMLARL